MTPHQFIATWKDNALTERASAQAHFIDLCRLLDHPTPPEADPLGEWYCFEKGAPKTGGGDGFADVWKRGFFAWEYKKRRRDLDAAMKQLVDYAAALENPPLHVVCDTIRFRIETRWTNTVTVKHEFEIEDLVDPAKLALLKAVFHDPEALRPKITRAQLTREAADKFQTISDRLQHRNPDREAVAHFVNQLVFCFFANSVGLLPDGLLRKLLDTAQKRPGRAKSFFDRLFAEMQEGGEFDLTAIRWFNGGLFDGRLSLALEPDEISLLVALQSFRWDLIDPTIFGTLFERFLDPDKRAQIGAHYTDPDKIMQIVEPVVIRPLRAEWEETRGRIKALMHPLLEEDSRGKSLGKRFDVARGKAEAIRDSFVDRLCALRILDPACGSGNFLYLALQAVKDLEYRALLECEEMLLGRTLPRVGPRILKGIEINPLAAELARTVIWIGDIQWGIRNGITHRPEPILEKLDGIECRDALLAPGPSSGEEAGEYRPIESAWPEADFIVGNPPFLGGKLMKRKLGRAETEHIRTVFADRLPGFTDLVCYWFEKARAEIERGVAKRAGLVATNSIRKNTNLPVMRRIVQTTNVFEAWSEEQWVVSGANVDVSLICFGTSSSDEFRLDGAEVSKINADLTTGLDLTNALNLHENRDGAYLGIQKSGPFDIAGPVARAWMREPLNPNGRPNSDVLKPYWNGDDLTGRPRDMWLIDLPLGLSESDAALFASPYKHLLTTANEDGKMVRELRSESGSVGQSYPWWQPWRPRPEMRAHARRLSRYIVTAETSQHRIFVWLKYPTLPDKNLITIMRDDDTIFGVLQSTFHEHWALRKGSDLEDRPRYTHTSTFSTFPFPKGLTPDIPAADYAGEPCAIRIAAAAKRLDELRQAWLNPPNLVAVEPEVVPGYPDRILPKDAEAATILKGRTLTKLYNERPTWLANAHAELDRAVAAAYGWPEDIAIDDALALLLALNLERSAAGR